MKKAFIIAGIVLGVAVVAVSSIFITKHFCDKEADRLTTQVNTLSASIAAMGEITTCYTVQAATFPGQEITADLVLEQSIPASFKNDSFASVDDVVGTYCKIAITPGTPITVDMLMTEPIADSLREIDITANRWPLGLQVGDYIDLRLTYPRGEDYIVLSHKRVMSLTDATLKIYLTEEEQALYQAALVDFYLSRSYGSDIYVTKYVEPGIQSAARPYYSVPSNIEAVMLLNPNIVNMAQVSVSGTLRASIEAARAKFATDDPSGSYIKSGRDELNSNVNADYALYEAEQEAAEKEGDDDATAGLITNLGGGVG